MKKILICLLAVSALVSCVPAKKFKDLEAKYSRLRKDNRNMSKELAEAKAALEKTKEERDLALVDLDALSNKYNEVSGEYDAAKANLAQLQDSYNALETNSSASIAENSKKNRQLLTELESKQNDLAEKTAALEAERKRLERLQKDLADRSARVDELEGLIAAKDAKMRGLKDAISKALTDFEGKGLTVEQRDGKYMSHLKTSFFLTLVAGPWVQMEPRQ